jgi:hypothetical protein
MKPPKHPVVIELNRLYGFKCDALSHIDMISFLTGIPQMACGEAWDKIRSSAPDLLDETGNIRSELLMAAGNEEYLSTSLTKLLSPLGVSACFEKPADSAKEFLEILENVWARSGGVLITVYVHRKTEPKPLGHVVGILKIESSYFIRDSNLPESIEVKKEDLLNMFDEPIALWENHAIALEKRFPIEGLFVTES